MLHRLTAPHSELILLLSSFFHIIKYYIYQCSDQPQYLLFLVSICSFMQRHLPLCATNSLPSGACPANTSGLGLCRASPPPTVPTRSSAELTPPRTAAWKGSTAETRGNYRIYLFSFFCGLSEITPFCYNI